MLKNKKFDFVGNLKLYLIVSAAIILVGLVVALVLGPVVHITFSGGTKITYSYSGEIDTDKVAQIAADTIGKTVGVDTTSGIGDDSQKLVISLAEKDALDAKLVDKLDDKLVKEFKDNKLDSAEVLSVSPSVGAVFFAKCLVAVLIAALLVIIYVAFRFRKIGGWLAGTTAMIALVHDILIAFTISVVFRLPIDANFIAVVMTLLGYSLNSTIVVFDRVRENKRIYGSKEPLDSLVNISNNQVMSRNIMTNTTTVFAILTVLVVCEICGITSLRSLTVPLCFGLISGAYSSVCLAPSIWVKWKMAFDAKKKERIQNKKKNGYKK